jgi:hypothetical protein
LAAKSVAFAPNTSQNISFFLIEKLQSGFKFLKHLLFIPLGSVLVFPFFLGSFFFDLNGFLGVAKKTTNIHR